MTGPRRSHPSDLLRFADLGMRLAILAGLFSYGGLLLDRWLQTAPIFLIAGAFLGMGLGMYSVVRAVEEWGRRRGPRDGGPSDEPP